MTKKKSVSDRISRKGAALVAGKWGERAAALANYTELFKSGKLIIAHTNEPEFSPAGQHQRARERARHLRRINKGQE